MSSSSGNDNITSISSPVRSLFSRLDSVMAQVSRMCKLGASFQVRENREVVFKPMDPALPAANGQNTAMVCFNEAVVKSGLVEETGTGEMIVEQHLNGRPGQFEASAAAGVDRRQEGKLGSTNHLGERLSALTKESRGVLDQLSETRQREEEQKRRLEELLSEVEACISEFSSKPDCSHEDFTERMAELKLLLQHADINQLDESSLQEQQKQLLADLNEKTIALASAEATIRELNAEKDALVASNNSRQQQLEEYKTRLEVVQTALDSATASERTTRVDGEISDQTSASKTTWQLTSEMEQLKEELDSAKVQLTGVDGMYAALQHIIDARTEHEEALQRNLDAKRAEFDRLSVEFTFLEQRLREVKQAAEETSTQSRRDCLNLHSQLLDANDHLLAVQHENERLVKLRDAMDADWREMRAKLEEALGFKEKFEQAEEALGSFRPQIQEALDQVAVLSATNENFKMQMGREMDEKQQRTDQLASLQSSYDVVSGQLQDAKEEIDRLTDEVNELNTMSEPYRAELEAFAAEKEKILGNQAVSNHALQELATKYAHLLGHQNNKQKIKHIMDLKEKLASLTQEVVKLRATTTRDVRRIQDLEVEKRRLEVQLEKRERADNKESSRPATPATIGRQQRQHQTPSNNNNSSSRWL